MGSALVYSGFYGHSLRKSTGRIAVNRDGGCTWMLYMYSFIYTHTSRRIKRYIALFKLMLLSMYIFSGNGFGIPTGTDRDQTVTNRDLKKRSG